MGHLIVACREKNLKTAFSSVHLSAKEGFQTDNLYEVLGATDKRLSCSGNGTFAQYQTEDGEQGELSNTKTSLFFKQIYEYLNSKNMFGPGHHIYIYFG